MARAVVPGASCVSSPLRRDLEDGKRGQRSKLKDDSEVLFPYLSAKSDTSRVEFWARRLSATPLIFIAQSTDRAPLGPMSLIAPLLGGRRVHALLMIAWTLDNPQILEAAVSAYRRHAQRFPSHRLTFRPIQPGKPSCSTAREFQHFCATTTFWLTSSCLASTRIGQEVRRDLCGSDDSI